MESKKEYIIPTPVIDKKEEESLVVLTERYNKLIEPKMLSKVSSKISSIIPDPVKRFGGNVKDTITEAELFSQCMKVIADGFNVLEKQTAKMSINEADIVKKINRTIDGYQIEKLEEICLARSYDISKSISSYKTQDLVLSLVEGGTTGYFGFAGLPFNIVLSMFLYYRAVQSIAMFYGYDVKNDPAELVIASEVFMSALIPSSHATNEITSIIGKVMLLTELTAVKQTAKKTWTEMAKRGGIGLLLTQMRALANKSAQKALEKAGQKGLENSLFKEIFEQIGKKLTKKALGKAIPVAGAVISALFDVAQMNTILEFSNVFYNKRYILEKEVRINTLLGIDDEIIIDSVTIEECVE